MKRLILHWDGGTGIVNDTARSHYHYMVDTNAKLHKGKYKVTDNENCTDGVYAQHTGGGNTGSIGVCMLGMYGFTEKEKKTNFPLTKAQFEKTCLLCAELCKMYNIKVTPRTVMTHYEFGLLNPSTSSRGKIDIIHLPFIETMETKEIGNFIRSKIRWYYNHLNQYKNLI